MPTPARAATRAVVALSRPTSTTICRAEARMMARVRRARSCCGSTEVLRLMEPVMLTIFSTGLRYLTHTHVRNLGILSRAARSPAGVAADEHADRRARAPGPTMPLTTPTAVTSLPRKTGGEGSVLRSSAARSRPDAGSSVDSNGVRAVITPSALSARRLPVVQPFSRRDGMMRMVCNIRWSRIRRHSASTLVAASTLALRSSALRPISPIPTSSSGRSSATSRERPSPSSSRSGAPLQRACSVAIRVAGTVWRRGGQSRTAEIRTPRLTDPHAPCRSPHQRPPPAPTPSTARLPFRRTFAEAFPARFPRPARVKRS